MQSTNGELPQEADTEQFDILDCTGEKTGEYIDRDRAHATGAWHGAFHCLIVYSCAGRATVLFQLRSREKKIAPGKFDVSVGGHYSAGEGPATAGPREIMEELGLAVSFDSLLPLGKRTFVYCFTPGVREYEFQDVYLLPLGNLTGLSFQKSEVEGALEMDVESGIRLFQGDVSSLACVFLAEDGVRNLLQVRPDDFVPCHDHYYLKLLQLARRYFDGERRGLVI